MCGHQRQGGSTHAEAKSWAVLRAIGKAVRKKSGQPSSLDPKAALSCTHWSYSQGGFLLTG